MKDKISSSILLIRNQRVMLDFVLASLYGVETKALNRAVKRNIERFPEDFMFILTKQELNNLKYQFGTSSSWGGRRSFPYAFTEHGVAMLSGILNSELAIKVNIDIIRIFIRYRHISSIEGIEKRLNELEKKYDADFEFIFNAVRQLVSEPKKEKKSIGFIWDKK
ncbi:MAG: ORF6N domain-containing protein [Gammaproteobacteria bacterium]|nr:ORF6N domain-containing protein [Gammaproteobacteria bacterium]